MTLDVHNHWMSIRKATRLRPIGIQLLQFLSDVGQFLLISSSNCPLEVSGKAGCDMLCGEFARITCSSKEHELVLARSGGHYEFNSELLRWVSNEMLAVKLVKRPRK